MIDSLPLWFVIPVGIYLIWRCVRPYVPRNFLFADDVTSARLAEVDQELPDRPRR